MIKSALQFEDITKYRVTTKQGFLTSVFGQQPLQKTSLAADASFRTYERIINKNVSYILMDCPLEHYSLDPFINIAQFLKANNFSAPDILAVDKINGFMLLEDFGDVNFGAYIYSNPSIINHQYKLILDLLNQLHQLPILPQIPEYKDDILLREVELFIDWYYPLIFPNHSLSSNIANLKTEFLEIWRHLLAARPVMPKCMVYRDYHLENLMVLDRPSIHSIGLLDFQDALIGSPLYDIVSVLEDSRFEVPRALTLESIEYFQTQNPLLDRADILLEYHILAAQRNCKILGIFARKAIRDKNPKYLELIPRTLKYLKYDLAHEKLSPLKKWLKWL